MVETMPPPLGHRRVHKQMRVNFRGGWYHAWKGESQGRALERVLEQLDKEGWRISFIVNDRFSILRRLFHYLIAAVTLLAIYHPENLIIIGERFEPIEPSEAGPADLTEPTG